MKRSTLFGCFVGLLALSMQAQVTQPSNSNTRQGTTKIEVQKKSSISIQDLLVKYNNVGNRSGSISEHFTLEEQQMLRSYFRDKQSGKQANVVKRQVGVLTESQRAADVDMKNLGINNPTSVSDNKNGSAQNLFRPLERSLFGTSNLSSSGAQSRVISNPVARTVSLEGMSNRILASVIITQSTTQNILVGNSVTCNTGGIPDENSFFRAFDLETNYGITDVFNVTSAEFAVESNTGPTNLTINIYSTSGTFPAGYPGNATLQGTANYVSGAGDTGTIVSVPITASIPVGDLMIYELKINAGATAAWFPGSNADGQTGTSYIMSTACGITTPTDLAAIGFPLQHMVMNIVGEEGGGGGSFPAPYCGPLEFSSSVEPITLVDVAGISNVTDATVGGTPAHEDFTAIEGDMEAGMSYPIAMEGNTDGGFTNSFVVFVDWNQNGVLNDAGEVYEMTDLLIGSTGTDGQQVNGDIAVPADALAGSTRMRVKKIFGTTNYLDPCMGASYGQAEDYTINVTSGGGGNAYCIPEGTNTNRFVNNFSTTGASENISNLESGFSAGGYGDFYDTDTVTQEQGGTVDFSVDIEGGTAGFRVWVDWNQDEVFDVAQEVAYSSNSYENTQTGTITVPTDALEGDTRMRIVSHWLSTTGDVDPCETGFTYGEFEDYKFTVTSGGGGTGGPCATTGPRNNFENGKSFTKNLGRIAANDLTVVDGEDMLLESITFEAFVGPTGSGINTDNVDVFIYEDNGAGVPGALVTSQLSRVPDSQVVVGNNFGFEAWSIVLDIDDVNLAGENGSATTYWIGLSLEATDGSNTFWQNSTAGVIGFGEAYDDGLGGGFIVDPTLEGVYSFDGTCSPTGGGGDCTPGSLDTTYAGGNGGSAGGAVYFDITVGPEDIEVSTLQTHTASTDAFELDMYVFEGTYVGNQENAALWGSPVATASGVGAGLNVPSAATLDTPIMMTANTTYAVALVFDATAAHTYTNGDGTNQNFSNDDLAIALGSASNTPFTAPIFDPRIWNGTIGYCVGGGGGTGGPLTTVYGINNANQDLIGFGVATPQNTEVFGTSPVVTNFENAGAIDPANPTTGYALDNGGQFYSFDVTTGFYTLLGNISGDWVGMEFDRTSGTLYAIAGADLYTIDPVAVTATLVGSTGINPGDLPIALAIDGAGVGYTYDLVADNLYSIDLATATATLIGNIGFDANFGQGMCYDPTTDMVYMSAFNGGSFAAEWRSVNTATGNTTLIGAIITPAATTQVAWSSIGETLDPPTCPQPTNLAVSNITETTADLSWNAEPNASNGYIWYVFLEGANPAVDPVVDTGTTPSGTTTATADGLANGTAYDFYVVADCDADGLSSYAGPITFVTVITPPECGGKFYDTGGPTGDYENNANVTTIISPDNTGDAVTVTFTSFDVESGWDALYVYDGPDATAPIISSGNPPTNGGFPAGGYYGTTIPGPFTSTHPSGKLTFVFLSDGSVPRAGWKSDVTCGPLGISDNTIEGFSFYPNPATTTLNLKSVDNIESMALFNMLGQRVIQTRINATTSQVDVSGLSTGTYLMKVTVDGQIGTYRVIKN